MIEIIPAIDLIDGRCVRLTQGDFSQDTVYRDDPVTLACRFEDAGLTRLHVVDLDGAKTGRMANLHVLERIARRTDLRLEFGGGIRTATDLTAVFDAGASIASIGSIAVRDPVRFAAFIERFGCEKILLGADTRRGKLSIDGWLTATDLEIIPFLRAQFAKGIREVFVTDIDRDGVLAGPAIGLYGKILEAIPGMKLIASGGVSKIEDIYKLRQIGCSGVIVGKAIYEGRVTLGELASINENVSKANNPVS